MVDAGALLDVRPQNDGARSRKSWVPNMAPTMAAAVAAVVVVEFLRRRAPSLPASSLQGGSEGLGGGERGGGAERANQGWDGAGGLVLLSFCPFVLACRHRAQRPSRSRGL